MTVSSEELLDQLTEKLDENSSLKPIGPQEAIERFLRAKKEEIRDKTVTEYRRKLEHFERFCGKNGVCNLNNLDRRALDDYYEYRKYDSISGSDVLATKTMRDEMYLLRDFIHYLETIDGVRKGLSNQIRVPSLEGDDGVRDIDLESERIENILEYVERYEYASRKHVVWLSHVHNGCRPGDLYSLDLCDLHLQEEDPYIQFKHRPRETGLKNDKKGEREAYLCDSVAEVFTDYINENRIEITTENGRETFLTSTHGRLSRTTMRKYVYKYSRPCSVDGECPHDRTPSTFEAAQSADTASRCPSSVPPYALRHGYLSNRLNLEVPIEIVGERCDVSPDVIKKHYDERSESQKRKICRQVFQEAAGDRGGYQ